MTIVTYEGSPMRNPLPNRYQIGELVTASNVRCFLHNIGIKTPGFAGYKNGLVSRLN